MTSPKSGIQKGKRERRRKLRGSVRLPDVSALPEVGAAGSQAPFQPNPFHGSMDQSLNHWGLSTVGAFSCSKALLPDRAIAVLSMLLALAFVLLMTLSIVNLRRVSMAWEALEDARMRGESSHSTTWHNLSQVQNTLDKRLSSEVKAIRIQLLNVSQEVEKVQWRMEQCDAGCGKELLGRLQDLEARNALEPVLQQVEGMKRELSVVLEEMRGLSRTLCPTCPAGWLQFSRTCYFFSNTTKSWGEAKEFCADFNGHLAIISSEQENKFLANHIMENRVFWLGLTDSDREDHWQWVDGSSLSLTFWNKGEPNNVGQYGEDCATIFPNGLWNDVSCPKKEAWICERSC